MNFLRKKAISILVLILSILGMIYGCSRGELSVVLGKAVTVCLECIGLG
ncbi:MAG: thioredoxin [Clostridiales bacterium]|nr:thioredoxin [Candidatus Blautia equi]